MRANLNWKLRLARRLRDWLAQPAYVAADFRACSPTASIDPEVYISTPSTVELADRATIYRGTKIFCGPGEFILGAHSHLAGDVYINAVRGRVRIGTGVAVGPKTVMVSYSNHYEAGKAITDTHVCGDILVDDDVFIGAAVIVLPGVEIGRGAVIGAGTIVRTSVAPYQVVAGNPARVVKTRQP